MASSYSNISGAANTPDSDAAHNLGQQQGPNTDGLDAIREGKQKAKETMAAAAAAGFTPGQSPASAQQTGTPNGSVQANGGPQLSRKRSRDGTQLPVSHTAGSRSANEPNPEHNDILLDRYVQRDLLSTAAMIAQDERSRELIKAKEMQKDFLTHEVASRRKQDPGSIYGYGFLGYGNSLTEKRNQIVYSTNRGPPKGRRSKQLPVVSRKDTAQQAEQHEELVPIRLDVELDKLRLRDTFTWNLHEKLIQRDLFTDYLLEDLKIPAESIEEVKRQISAEMQDQIHNYYPHIIVEDGALEPGKAYSDHKDDEMRIQIKLNITIGRITLLDQFEWDINNPLNSPEEFARQMAWENALSGEFTTAIAHSIREQSQLYTKSLYLTNHCFDGRPIEDPDLRDSFLPAPVHSAFRPPAAQKDWTPYMYEMSEAELERTETSMMREHRAQKRQLNRRGGPALPDLKDRQRTVRSLLVHTVIPGSVDTFETSGILKTRRGGRNARRGARPDGDVDSDELDSEESSAESPAPTTTMITGGTARTRGMRGAAAAAQANMRAGYGRSATPDSQILSAPQTEPRASTRKSMLREESAAADEEQLIVKLKIGKAKLKAWWEEYRAKKRASEFPLSGYASQPPPSNTNLRVGTPSRGGTSTPTMTPRSLPAARNTPQPNGNHARAQPTSAKASNVQYDARGAVDVEYWPSQDDPAIPAPPPWLQTAIETLRDENPRDNFEPLMRAYCINADSGSITKVSPSPTPGDPPPAGVKFQYLPRIRCNDCPGKLYTAIPDRVLEDFAVHLRNKGHRAKVEDRVAGRTREG